jgi:hypothetical protein
MIVLDELLLLFLDPIVLSGILMLPSQYAPIRLDKVALSEVGQY